MIWLGRKRVAAKARSVWKSSWSSRTTVRRSQRKWLGGLQLLDGCRCLECCKRLTGSILQLNLGVREETDLDIFREPERVVDAGCLHNAGKVERPEVVVFVCWVVIDGGRTDQICLIDDPDLHHSPACRQQRLYRFAGIKLDGNALAGANRNRFALRSALTPGTA